MAAAKELDRGYLCRLLQLTPLAPDVVEAIFEGRQADGVALPGLLEPFPMEWSEQCASLDGAQRVELVGMSPDRSSVEVSV